MNNKEKIKVLIYNYIVNNLDFNFSFLGGEFKYYTFKVEDGKKELNRIIDNIDIRNLPVILENHPQLKVFKWVRKKEYIIDYDKNNELDFIRIKKECYC